MGEKMNKKIIFSIVALAILLVPTVCVGATQNVDASSEPVCMRLVLILEVKFFWL